MRRSLCFCATIGTTLAALFLSACDTEGLNIGNLVHEGNALTFKLANDSGNTGDVVMWIRQNDLTFCERVVRVQARQVYDIRLGCPSLQGGRAHVRATWATNARERALVAQRIE